MLFEGSFVRFMNFVLNSIGYITTKNTKSTKKKRHQISIKEC
jgi:hypothetical protein